MTESKAKKEEVVIEPKVSQVQASTTTEAVQTVKYVTVEAPAKKGGFGWGKCFLIGCGLIVVCCVCTVVFAVVAPNVLLKAVTGGNKAPDATLMRVQTAQELTTIEDSLLSETSTKITIDPVTGGTKLNLTEKEAISFIYYSLGLNTPEKPMAAADITKLGMQFTPGNAKIQIDLSLFFAAIADASAETSQNVDPKVFEGVNISVDLGTSADNKTVIVKDFSTGNTVIDGLLTPDVRKQLIDSIQKSMEESSATTETTGTTLEKIVFSQGSVEIILTDSATTP